MGLFCQGGLDALKKPQPVSSDSKVARLDAAPLGEFATNHTKRTKKQGPSKKEGRRRDEGSRKGSGLICALSPARVVEILRSIPPLGLVEPENTRVYLRLRATKRSRVKNSRRWAARTLDALTDSRINREIYYFDRVCTTKRIMPRGFFGDDVIPDSLFSPFFIHFSRCR